jgi:hypothetical protein
MSAMDFDPETGYLYGTHDSHRNLILIDPETASFTTVAKLPLRAWGGTFPSVPAVITVTIDIKPGSDPNCFNNNGKGVIPVAIFGSESFSVEDIDPGSISLEGLPVKTVGKKGKLLAHYEDSNADGFVDLVVQIEDIDETFSQDGAVAALTGTLYSGARFKGEDTVCLKP